MSAPPTDNAFLLWLQDDSHNDFLTKKALKDMYACFDASAASPLAMLKDDDRKHCLLAFVKEGGCTTAALLHHAERFPARMGRSTPWDGKWFMTAGQSIDGHWLTYNMPDDILDCTAGPSQTYVADRIQREIADTPGARELEIFVSDENLEDLNLISTRRSMWIPNHFAALLLEENLSPIDVWERLYGALVRDGVVDVCLPLLEFLSYQILGGAPSNAAAFADLSQPNANAALVRHRQEIVAHMSAPTVPNVAGTASGLSAADFRSIVEALKIGNATVSSVPKVGLTTPEKRWGVNLDTLLKYCHVSKSEDLPPVWFALAKGPRKEERSIVQSALDEQSRSATAATSVPLLVTKELHTTIVTLMFWPGDLDRLDEGLHPFRTIYSSAAKTSSDQMLLHTYDALAAEGMLRLEDLQLFQRALKSNWPVDFIQLDTSLKLFLNLLLVLFGAAHPLSVSYQSFIALWNSLSVQLAEQFGGDPAKPALFLRSVQLRMSVYWQTVSTLSTSQSRLQMAPNFSELLTAIRIQTWQPPTMPGVPVSVPSVNAKTPPAVPIEQPGGLSVPEPAARTSITNPTMDEEIIKAMEGRQFQLRKLFVNGIRPPKTSTGQDICCSYHLKGRCFSDCQRRATHRQLPKVDMNKLKTFATNHIVTPDVGKEDV